MTALDRALIKAYRADFRGSALSGAGGFLRALDAESDDASSPGIAIHASEPVLQGPHFRIRRGPDSQSADAAESFEGPFAPTIAIGASFRVDVGMTSPAPSTRLTYSSDSANEPTSPPAPYILRKHKAEIPAPAIDRAEEAPSEVHLTSRPLSSFAETHQEAADDGRPQLVVDGFAWTDSCEKLCQRSLGVFDDFLTTLISQIAAGRKAIGIVGIDSAAGGTTVALCLARLLALKGLKTAVVDANFERPEIAEHLGVRVTEGWNAALAGTVPLGEVMIESLGDRLTLAPLCESIDARPVLAPSLRSSLVWRMLREPHEAVLVDCGDLANDRAADNLKQLGECLPLDAVYMVCDKRTTTPQELVHASRQMKSLGLNLLGTIENFIE